MAMQKYEDEENKKNCDAEESWRISECSERVSIGLGWEKLGDQTFEIFLVGQSKHFCSFITSWYNFTASDSLSHKLNKVSKKVYLSSSKV